MSIIYPDKLISKNYQTFTKRPISASKLEAVRMGMRMIYMAYVMKPKVQQNAEYASGDAVHKTFATLGDSHYKNAYSFVGAFKRRFQDLQEVDFDKKKYGMHFPIPGRGQDFYELHYSNVLKDYYFRNKDFLQAVVEARDAIKNDAEKKVIAKYTAQQKCKVTIGHGKANFLRLTKKEIDKATKHSIAKEKKKRLAEHFPLRESRITFTWNGFHLIAIPDMLGKLDDDSMYYLDYKIVYDIVKHQFPMVKLAVQQKYKLDDLLMYKLHLIDRRGRFGGEEQVFVDSEDYASLEKDLDRTKRIFDDIEWALNVHEKMKAREEKTGQMAFSLHDPDQRNAAKILDPRNYQRCDGCIDSSPFTVPQICNYRKHCDALDANKDVKDLDLIIDDYYTNVRNIETLWSDDDDDGVIPF